MMKIASLEATDVDRDLLDIWQRTVGEDLLPVQERAVRELNLLGAANDRNLIVFSPTSSGKTLVGEMAAAQVATKVRSPTGQARRARPPSLRWAPTLSGDRPLTQKRNSGGRRRNLR